MADESKKNTFNKITIKQDEINQVSGGAFPTPTQNPKI